MSCRSEEHTSELQSHSDIVCRLLLEKKKERILLRPLYTAMLLATPTCSAILDLNIIFYCWFFFFFNDTATTEIYTLSLHDALPISRRSTGARQAARIRGEDPFGHR